jgi:mannitol-1-phosphate 5-dehydrogenase
MWQHSPHSRTLLVEDYDLLLINKITLPKFRRGISIFVEKEDLLPFKEAKLFGHNGTHAISAYIGRFLGISRITDLVGFPAVLVFLRNAFLNEVGMALCRKYSGFDPLFTTDGFTEFVDGIISRMVNPHLLDTVARVGRDPRRKLGWEDRLIGAIRLALKHNVRPVRYAFGAAAALVTLDSTIVQQNKSVHDTLLTIWHPQTALPLIQPTAHETGVIHAVEEGMDLFTSWQASRYSVDFLDSHFS